MRNTKLLFFFLMVLALNVSAQDKKLDQCLFLQVEEKYDKLVDKAGFLTENDNYRRHPLPYYYVSVGYYEISRRADKYDVEDKYKKPLKSAQQFAYKFYKKDKKKEYVGDYTEYFDLLADTSVKLAQHWYKIDKFRKSASVFKYAFRFYPEDPVLQLWQGIMEYKSMNKGEGIRNALAGLEKIDENFEPKPATKPIIANGMLILEQILNEDQTAKIEDKSGKTAKAKNLVEVFKKYDPDELDRKKMEERKKKAKEDDKVIRKFYSEDEEEKDE